MQCLQVLCVWASQYINNLHTSVEGKGTTILHSYTITNTHTHSKVSTQEPLRTYAIPTRVRKTTQLANFLLVNPFEKLCLITSFIVKRLTFYPSGLMRPEYKGLSMRYVSAKCYCVFFLGWSIGSCMSMTPHLHSGTPYSHNYKDRSLPPNVLYFLYLIMTTRVCT